MYRKNNKIIAVLCILYLYSQICVMSNTDFGLIAPVTSMPPSASSGKQEKNSKFVSEVIPLKKFSTPKSQVTMEFLASLRVALSMVIEKDANLNMVFSLASKYISELPFANDEDQLRSLEMIAHRLGFHSLGDLTPGKIKALGVEKLIEKLQGKEDVPGWGLIPIIHRLKTKINNEAQIQLITIIARNIYQSRKSDDNKSESEAIQEQLNLVSSMLPASILANVFRQGEKIRSIRNFHVFRDPKLNLISELWHFYLFPISRNLNQVFFGWHQVTEFFAEFFERHMNENLSNVVMLKFLNQILKNGDYKHKKFSTLKNNPFIGQFEEVLNRLDSIGDQKSVAFLVNELSGILRHDFFSISEYRLPAAGQMTYGNMFFKVLQSMMDIHSSLKHHKDEYLQQAPLMVETIDEYFLDIYRALFAPFKLSSHRATVFPYFYFIKKIALKINNIPSNLTEGSIDEILLRFISQELTLLSYDIDKINKIRETMFSVGTETLRHFRTILWKDTYLFANQIDEFDRWLSESFFYSGSKTEFNLEFMWFLHQLFSSHLLSDQFDLEKYMKIPAEQYYELYVFHMLDAYNDGKSIRYADQNEQLSLPLVRLYQTAFASNSRKYHPILMMNCA